MAMRCKARSSKARVLFNEIKEYKYNRVWPGGVGLGSAMRGKTRQGLIETKV